MYVHDISFILSSVDEHLGHSHMLPPMNNAEMKTGMRTSPQDPDFVYFEYLYFRMCVFFVASQGSSTFLVSGSSTLFSMGPKPICIPMNRTKFLLSPHAHQRLYLWLFSSIK